MKKILLILLLFLGFGAQAQINWTVATRVPNRHTVNVYWNYKEGYKYAQSYQVQYAYDGVNYQTLIQVNAELFESRWLFTDWNNYPARHNGRYRIMTMRKDGAIEYSLPFAVEGNERKLFDEIYTNWSYDR